MTALPGSLGLPAATGWTARRQAPLEVDPRPSGSGGPTLTSTTASSASDERSGSMIRVSTTGRPSRRRGAGPRAPCFVIAALRRHRAAQAERRPPRGRLATEGHVDDLVVERGGGEPWHLSTFSTYWCRFAKRSGFEGVTFHGLRHGTGALLLDAGVPDTVALAIMAIAP